MAIITRNWFAEIQYADDMAAASLDQFPGTSTYSTVGKVDGSLFECLSDDKAAEQIYQMFQNDFAPNNNWTTDSRIEDAVKQSPGYDKIPAGSRSMSVGDRIVFRNLVDVSDHIVEVVRCFTLQVTDVGFKIVKV